MLNLAIAPGVKKILEQCACVKPGERLLIVTDTAKDRDIVDAFAFVATALGADVAVMITPPHSRNEKEPPAQVASALKSADLVIELATGWYGRSNARMEATKSGVRYVCMAGIGQDRLVKGSDVDADFLKLRPFIEAVAQKFDQAKTIRLVTKAGTDLAASIEGRRGRRLDAIADRSGVYTFAPHVEVGTSPVEGSAEGVVVVDGAITPLRCDVKNPFRMVVKSGKLERIEGGDGYMLQELLDSIDDPNRYNLAEIAVGMNPYSKSWVGESRLGSSHVALGDSIAYGGTVHCKAHLDLVERDATVYLDGDCIMKDGVMQGFAIPY